MLYGKKLKLAMIGGCLALTASAGLSYAQGPGTLPSKGTAGAAAQGGEEQIIQKRDLKEFLPEKPKGAYIYSEYAENWKPGEFLKGNRSTSLVEKLYPELSKEEQDRLVLIVAKTKKGESLTEDEKAFASGLDARIAEKRTQGQSGSPVLERDAQGNLTEQPLVPNQEGDGPIKKRSLKEFLKEKPQGAYIYEHAKRLDSGTTWSKKPMTPLSLDQLFPNLSEEERSKLQGIVDKMKKGESLTPDDKNFMAGLKTAGAQGEERLIIQKRDPRELLEEKPKGMYRTLHTEPFDSGTTWSKKLMPHLKCVPDSEPGKLICSGKKYKPDVSEAGVVDSGAAQKLGPALQAIEKAAEGGDHAGSASDHNK